MPAIADQHQPGVAIHIDRALDLLECLVQDSLIQRLPFHVHALELLRQRRRFDGIVAQQKPESINRVTYSPRRVEPRSQNESHMACADLLAGESSGFNERLHPRPPTLAQKLETVLY